MRLEHSGLHWREANVDCTVTNFVQMHRNLVTALRKVISYVSKLIKTYGVDDGDIEVLGLDVNDVEGELKRLRSDRIQVRRAPSVR